MKSAINRLARAACFVAMTSSAACSPLPQEARDDASIGADAGVAIDGDIPLDAAQDPLCGVPCPGDDTFWDPYVRTCLVVPSIDPPGDSQPVCGCDGREYPSAAIAARRGIRSQREPGRCGDALTACDDRTCTSSEYCDHTFCEGSGTCRSRATSCEAPTTDSWSCGCDGVWYESDCARRMTGVSLAFDDADCGPLPARDASRLFITSTVFRGGEVGGLARADAECQARADAASLGGSWVAFLVDATHGLERIPGDAQWSNLDGERVFADRAAFEALQVTPHSRFAVYEDGTSASEGSFWLGTDLDPRHAREHCGGWTSLDGDWAPFGYIRAREADWQTVLTSDDGCAYFPGHSLLCVER